MDSDLINTEVAVVIEVVAAAMVEHCRVCGGGGVLGWQGGEVITDTGLHLLFINGKLLDSLCSLWTPPPSSHLIIAQSSSVNGPSLFICLFYGENKRSSNDNYQSTDYVNRKSHYSIIIRWGPPPPQWTSFDQYLKRIFGYYITEIAIVCDIQKFRRKNTRKTTTVFSVIFRTIHDIHPDFFVSMHSHSHRIISSKVLIRNNFKCTVTSLLIYE